MRDSLNPTNPNENIDLFYLLDSPSVQLIFEGIRGSSYTGDVAIDNVVLKECGGGGGGGGGGCGKFLKMPLSITKNDKWTEY